MALSLPFLNRETFTAILVGFVSGAVSGETAVELTLEHSSDQREWKAVTILPEMIDHSGTFLLPEQDRVEGAFVRLKIDVHALGSRTIPDTDGVNPAHLNLYQSSSISGASPFSLEHSRNLHEWYQLPLLEEMLSGSGSIVFASGETTQFFRLNLNPTAPGPDTPEDMVQIRGGSLVPLSGLGAITVSDFQIGRSSTDWSRWQTVLTWAVNHGYEFEETERLCANDHPVHGVSWHDVVKWCNARSEMEGLTPVYTVEDAPYRTGQFIPDFDASANGYRLPTEAEWEFAARGGNLSRGHLYSGSDSLGAVGWYRENSKGAACDLLNGRGVHPAAQKHPNELGLYDMSGNLWEWCWPESDPLAAPGSPLRGGSWLNDAAHCRIAVRARTNPKNRRGDFGFRLARSLNN